MGKYVIRHDDFCVIVVDTEAIAYKTVAKVWYDARFNAADAPNKTQAKKLARAICKLYNEAQVKQ